jgi:hypothetical protein
MLCKFVFRADAPTLTPGASTRTAAYLQLHRGGGIFACILQRRYEKSDALMTFELLLGLRLQGLLTLAADAASSLARLFRRPDTSA